MIHAFLYRCRLFYFFGILLSSCSFICFLALPAKSEEPVIFISTQMHPPKEAFAMRTSILSAFPGNVEFVPYSGQVFTDKLLSSKGLSADLIGGNMSDFITLKDANFLRPFTEGSPTLTQREYLPALLELGQFDNGQYFVPWMQATYLMVARREALKYLPEQAQLDHLSYDQLIAWAANIHAGTGTPKLGFPAGNQGLFHRFIQGYLYPSFTGGMISTFRHPRAVDMWRKLRELWEHCNVHSLSFSSMYEPLQSGEVWLGWDHSARLFDIFEQNPEDFIAFPAPVGPQGRGFMIALTGLGLPQKQPLTETLSLIDFLLSPVTQQKILEISGFFPVIKLRDETLPPRYLQSMLQTVSQEVSDPQAIISVLPYGFGNFPEQFNQIYKNSFTKIVLRHKDIVTVLNEQTRKLRNLLAYSYATCFPPDPPSLGPCPVY